MKQPLKPRRERSLELTPRPLGDRYRFVLMRYDRELKPKARFRPIPGFAALMTVSRDRIQAVWDAATEAAKNAAGRE